VVVARGIARVGLIAAVLGAVGGVARGHPGHEQLADAADASAPARGTSNARKARAPEVQITTKDGYRHITSNGIPDHPTGAFPNRNNPNAISAQRYTFRVPLEPKAGERPTNARGMLFGVALNGVPFDPGTAEFWNSDRRAGWNYEAIGGPINLGLDESRAHVQPTGAYHYHGIPTAMIDRPAGTKRGTGAARIKSPTTAAIARMTLVGYAADGFPIYGPDAPAAANDRKSPLRRMKSSYRLKSGTRPGGNAGPGGKYDGSFTADYEYVAGAGDLDDCNGRTGVTPEYPDGTYYYVLTDDFPFVPRLLRGAPDETFRKREGPGGLGGPGRGPRGPGSPPGTDGPRGPRRALPPA
jgi:hypothetical protein